MTKIQIQNEAIRSIGSINPKAVEIYLKRPVREWKPLFMHRPEDKKKWVAQVHRSLERQATEKGWQRKLYRHIFAEDRYTGQA